jgi:hypothetical protein
VKHEPSRLLGNADGAGQFVGADAVLGIGDHPDGGEPFVQGDRRVLEDGSDLHRKLALGVLVLALPEATSRDVAHVVPATGGALNYAIGPAERHHEFLTNVRVGEVTNGF